MNSENSKVLLFYELAFSMRVSSSQVLATDTQRGFWKHSSLKGVKVWAVQMGFFLRRNLGQINTDLSGSLCKTGVHH